MKTPRSSFYYKPAGNRVSDTDLADKIKEIILAMDSNAEGETTALYLSETIQPLKIKISRIAYGIPVGGNLEYADQATLIRAIEGRLPVSNRT